MGANVCPQAVIIVLKLTKLKTGVVRADPDEYTKRFGSELKDANKMPSFVQEVKNPEGLKLANEYVREGPVELEGDLCALTLVDLEKEGLGEYRNYLVDKGILQINQASNRNSSLFAYAKSNCSIDSRVDENDMKNF